MRTLLLTLALSVVFVASSNAQDPGLPSGVTCTCVANESPLLYTLVVYTPGGYPSSEQTYGPYTIEQCQQAIGLIPIGRYCNK